jgi:type III secretion protein T
MNFSGQSESFSQLIALSYPVLATLPRFGVALMILPLLVSAIIPRQIRIGFLLVTVLVAQPHMQVAFSVNGWSMAQWMMFVLKEALLGGLIGYAVGLGLWALTAVGELIDLQAGMTNAQIFDPFGKHSSGPFSVLMSQLGMLLFLGFGGLHVFLQLLYESLLLWPPASFTPDLTASFKDFAVATSGSLLEVAVRFAAPVIGVLLLIELGIGLINRAAPQIDAFYFSMPIKAVTALLVLALLLTHLADVVKQSVDDSRTLLPKLDSVLRNR